MNRAAQEPENGTAMAQTNSVSRAERTGTGHWIIVEQRTLTAEIVQDEGAVIVDNLAMTCCHVGIIAAIKVEMTAILRAENERRFLEQIITPLKVQSRRTGVGRLRRRQRRICFQMPVWQ